jgi:tetratricopeptide (TPR) repeat protein
MPPKTAVAGALVLLAATVVTYIPAYSAGFIWDDDAYVTDNTTLRDAAGLRRIWTEPGAVPQYYPLVHTTFWLEYHVWGLNPVGYHVVNVLLHAVNAVLVWQALRRLELPGAWLVGAVFALHPVEVESVVWITERKNTLSALFYLLALLAYLRFAPLVSPEPAPRDRRWIFYGLALLAFAAALLSKTVTCSLPAAILLLTWWQRGRIARRDVTPLLPFFALGAGLSAVTIRMELHHVGAQGAEWALSFMDRVLVASRALWFYAGKLLWPHNLAFIYERWTINAAVAWQYLFPLAALALVLVLWLLRRHIGRGPLVAVLFFGGTLFPALGFINVYPMRYSFVADHFQYLAGLGLMTVVIAAAAHRLRTPAWGRKAAPLLGAALLLVLGVCTWRQGRIYDNLETLWRDTLAKSPTAYIASNNLGAELGRQGRHQEAIPYLETATRQCSDDVQCWNNLASAYADVGRTDDALQAYAVALQHGPNDAMTHFNLGTTYAQTGRLDEGIRHLTAALHLRPRHAPTRKNLTQAVLERAAKLLENGDSQQAVPLLTKALQDLPESLPIRLLLAHALGETGQSRAAIARYRECLAAQPDFVEALSGLAWRLATDPDPAVRHGPEALTLAERAAQLTKSDDPAVLDTLAAALAETGQFGRAVEVARQARALAERRGAASLVVELDARLKLYAAQTPYHAPVQPPPASRPS